MAATLKDLARYTGYSVGTISNYITNKTPVSPEKQKRIEEAIATLNYKVNLAARMLKTNEYKSIGILIPDFKSVFLINIISYIEVMLADSGYDTVLLSYNNDIYKEKKLLIKLSQSVDGILYVPLSKDFDELIMQIQQNTPVVTFDQTNQNINCDKVLTDNIASSERAVDILFEKGHINIATLLGRKGDYTAQLRKNGYINAFEKRGLHANEDLILFGDYSKASGYVLCEQLLDAHPEITAIFVACHLMTLGVIAQLKKRNLEGKVAVIGYDMSDLHDVVLKPVGYIHQSHSKIAELSTKIILKRVSGDMSNFPQTLEVSTEIRNTRSLICVENETPYLGEFLQIPHVIDTKRTTTDHLGGKMLDEWQRKDNAKDNDMGKEILLSTGQDNDKMFDICTTTLPDGNKTSLSNLIRHLNTASTCLPNNFSPMEISVCAGDTAERQTLRCRLSFKNEDLTTNSSETFHIIKTRWIDGIEPHIYLGLKENISEETWRSLCEKQDITAMLNCMHKYTTHEGMTINIRNHTPYCISAGNFMINSYNPNESIFSFEESHLSLTIQDLNSPYICYDTKNYPEDLTLNNYNYNETYQNCMITPFPIIKSPVITLEQIANLGAPWPLKVEKYTFSQVVSLPDYNRNRIIITVKCKCQFSSDNFNIEAQQGRAVFIPRGIEGMEIVPIEGETVVFIYYFN